MLNIIWPIFILASAVYAIVAGNVDSFNQGIFDAGKNAVELMLSFLGTMCLWNGLMEIIKKTSLITKLVKMLQPLLKWLFPDLKRKEKAKQEIAMNMIANFLGLGNAATPLGLKAMKTLQEDNTKKDTLSDTMAMFLIVNTASLQLIPTTTLAIRNSLNSTDATQVVVPIWIATLSAAITGILLSKVFMKRF